MKIKEQKIQSVSNEKRPYEKPVLHVLNGLQSTDGKPNFSYNEIAIGSGYGLS
jgi:hypothetical protein